MIKLEKFCRQRIAIGSNGQNIKLASDVTEYTIDVIKKSEYETNQEINLTDVDGLTEKLVNLLKENNITTSKDFLTAEKEELLKIKSFGEKTLEKTTEIIREAISG